MGFFSGIGKAFSSVLGGAANAVTGILGMNSKQASDKANADANSAQLALAREQFEYQKELHKNQMQWRVEDAKKAGLHPMAALGLQGSSLSPVSASFTPMQGDDYSWISDIGQNAGYAAMKGKDRGEQEDAMALAVRQSELQLENMQLQNEGAKLDNEYRRWQLQKALSGATGQALRSPASASVSSPSSQGDARISAKKDSDFELGTPFFPLVPTEKPGVFNFGVDSDSLDALGVFAPFALPFPSFKTEGARFFNLRPTVKDSYGRTITTIYSPKAQGFVDIKSRLGQEALKSERYQEDKKKERIDAAKRFWRKPSWRDYFKSKSLF